MKFSNTSRRVIPALLAFSLATGPVFAENRLRYYVPELLAGSTVVNPPPYKPPVGGHLVLDQTSVDFGQVMVSSGSTSRILTVTNDGTQPVGIGEVRRAAPGFQVKSLCPTVLAASASCQVLVGMSPTELKSYSGTVTVVGSSNSPSANLLGEGVAATLTMTPTVADFGTVAAGATVTKVFHLANTGSDLATLGETDFYSAPGVRVAGTTCLPQLPAGAACTYTLEWTPTRAMTFDMASFSVGTSRGGLSAELVGTALGADIKATPSGVLLDTPVAAGGTLSRTVTFQNQGNTTAQGLQLTPELTTGATFTSNCPTALAAGQACTGQITVPTSVAKAFTGQIKVASSNARVKDVPVSIEVGGVAAPVLVASPSSVELPTTKVGQTSAAVEVTVTNTGTQSVSLASLVPKAGLVLDPKTCQSATLAPEASCVFSVKFQPVRGELYQNSIRVADSLGSGVNVAVTGTALEGVLSPAVNPIEFGEVEKNTSSVRRSVTVRNVGNDTAAVGAVQGSVAGVTPSSACPSTLEAGQSCTVAFDLDTATERSLSGSFRVLSGTREVTFPVSGSVGALALSLSSKTVAFGNQPYGLPGTVKSVVVTNNSSQAISNLSVGASGPFLTTTNCTSSLPAQGSCTVNVQSNFTSAGAQSGQLVASGGGYTVSAELTGTGEAPAAVPSSSSVTFPETVQGESATPQQVLITNPHTVAVSTSNLVLTAPAAFGMTHNCPATLQPAQTCLVNLTFTPDFAGTRSGTVTGPGFGINVTGKGLATGKLAASTTLLEFGPAETGETTPAQKVRLTNTGTTSVTLNGITLDNTSAFGMTNTCGASVAAGAFCDVFVTPLNATYGVFTGSVLVSSAEGALFVALSSEVAPKAKAVVTPSSLDFGLMDRGFESAPKTLTVMNTGNAPMTVDKTTVTGDGAAYAVTNNCGTVEPGASCTLSVKVTSSGTSGAHNGELVVETNGGSPAVSLSVTSQVPVLSFTAPGGQSKTLFPTTTVDQTSASQVFTLQNAGPGRAALEAPVTSGDFTVASTTCGATLAVGASCTVSVAFAPKAGGTRTGAVAVASSGTKPTLSALLEGQGVQPFSTSLMSASPSPLAFSVAAGSGIPHTQQVTVTNGNTAAVELGGITTTHEALTVERGTCTSGLLLEAGASCTLTVAFYSDEPLTLSAQTVTMAIPNRGASYSMQVSSAVATSSAPVLTSLSKTSAVWGSGDKVTLNGSSFYSTAAVMVNGSTAPSSWKMTRLSSSAFTFTVGELPTGTYSLKVVSAYGESSTLSFTVLPKVELSSATLAFSKYPNQVMVGASGSQSVSLLSYGGAATLLSAPYVTGSTAFSATTSCGSTVPANGSCATSVTFSPTSSSPVTGSLVFETNAGTFTVALSGAGATSLAVWSTSASSITAPTGAAMTYGPLTPSTTQRKTFYVKNAGTSGRLSVGFALTGDTGHFKLTGQYRISTTGAGGVCGTVAADGLSTTPCLSEDIAGGTYSVIRLDVDYTPKAAGTHTVSVVPSSDNGTGVPDPMTLTGTAIFNPTAVWSSSAGSNTALTSATTTYAKLTAGLTTSDKVLYLRNTGTNGALSVGFTLSGDTSQFRINGLYRVNTSGNGATCGVVSADKLSATPCLATDIAGGLYPVIELHVLYAPTVVGSHSITVTPSTDNGTTIPEPVTLTGSAGFDPTAVWSTTAGSLTPPTTASATFAPLTVGSSNYKVLYLRNVGTRGPLSVGFSLSGDTSEFQIMNVYRVATSGNGGGCNILAADKLSSSPCLAEDINGGLYPFIRITVMYKPTVPGNHSITVSTNTDNGTTLPSSTSLFGSAN